MDGKFSEIYPGLELFTAYSSGWASNIFLFTENRQQFVIFDYECKEAKLFHHATILLSAFLVETGWRLNRLAIHPRSGLDRARRAVSGENAGWRDPEFTARFEVFTTDPAWAGEFLDDRIRAHLLKMPSCSIEMFDGELVLYTDRIYDPVLFERLLDDLKTFLTLIPTNLR